MYIMQGGEGKTRICKQYYTKKIEDWESERKNQEKSSRKAKLFS